MCQGLVDQIHEDAVEDNRAPMKQSLDRYERDWELIVEPGTTVEVTAQSIVSLRRMAFIAGWDSREVEVRELRAALKRATDHLHGTL